MAKRNDFKDKVSQLAESIKNKQPDTPLQEVRPVELPAPSPPPARKPAKEADPRGAHFNFFGEFDLMDRIKLHAFTERKTMKEVCNEALEYYMTAVGKPRH